MVLNFLQVQCLRVWTFQYVPHSTHQFTPICKLWNMKFSMFCIIYFWLCFIIAYIFTNCNTFSQNIFKNIFQKPIDKCTKICYSNRGSPSPIKKEHTLLCLNVIKYIDIYCCMFKYGYSATSHKIKFWRTFIFHNGIYPICSKTRLKTNVRATIYFQFIDFKMLGFVYCIHKNTILLYFNVLKFLAIKKYWIIHPIF